MPTSESSSTTFKVKELMANKTISPDYQGFSTANDWVFAIDISGLTGTHPDEYEVLQTGISGVDASLEAQTEDANYLRAGQSTLKTGTQRSFALSGDRYIGSAAQDFMFSYKIKFGTGQTVIVPYVYFNMLTGIGEKGKVSVIVNSDAAGEAGSKSTIDVEFRTVGEAPVEYTYTPSKTIGVISVTSVGGLGSGKSKITVLPPLFSGNTYKYQTGASVVMPGLNQILSSWTAWDGVSDIDAVDGQEIVIAEVSDENKAMKAGHAVIRATI